MLRVAWTVIIAGLMTAVFAPSAEAQMFGARNSFGTSLQPQTNAGGGAFGGPTPAPGIGQGAGPTAPSVTSVASPDARFMRKNRTANNFVGIDPGDVKKPVGMSQAPLIGNNQPAAMDAVERRVPESLVNPTRQAPPRTRMYEPKLSIGFRQPPRSAEQITESLQNQLQYLNRLDPSMRIQMTVVGETAHLQGEVSSEEERALIEQLMLFEPGISSVRSDLRVPVADPPMPSEG